MPALALALLIGLATAGPGWAKAEPGAMRGGTVTKTGWWWLANQPPAETGLVAHPQQSPPNVPKGHLPVSAAGGEPEKVSAVELRLKAEPGAFAERATLVLRESTEPGASSNAEGATVQACPVTEPFWADGAGARWDSRPKYDCDLAQAPGVRDKKGLWTFDLTSVAALWLTPGATASTSVVLVEGAEPPDSFQVTFAGVQDKGVGFDGAFAASGGSGTSGGALGGSGGGLASSSGGAGLGGSSGGGALDSGSLTPGSSVPAPVDAPAEDAGTVQTTEPMSEDAIPVAAPAVAPPWYSGLPRGAILLLPVALGLAYLTMLALGPEAQPAATSTGRGVSRALERLRTAGAGAIAGVRR